MMERGNGWTHKLLSSPDMSRIKKSSKKSRSAKSAFVVRHRDELLRKHRQVIYFNDPEMAAIDEYCSRFKVHAKASLFREAIMDKVLTELEENHPTLF